MAKLSCSVDTEPKTLKRGQMHHAREVAVGIFQKIEPAEASNVLTVEEEGQVASVEMDKIVELTEEGLCQQATESIAVGRSQRCSCTNPSIDEEVDYDGHLIREPHTAPF